MSIFFEKEAVAQFSEIFVVKKEVETGNDCSELKDHAEAADSNTDVSISLTSERLRALSFFFIK